MADEHHDDDHGHGKKKKHGGHGGGHGGGGHHEEGEAGAPEWLISFADNVALMMGFFVVLLAMNMSKPDSAGGAEGPSDGKAAAASSEEQMLDWAIGIREAFNNPVDSSNPSDAILSRRVREREAEALARTPGQKGIEREVKSIRQTNNYSRGGTVPFSRGTVELDDEGRAALAEIVKHRKGVLRNVVDVRGHASAAEAHDLSDRGMKLSFLRAQTVADGLIAAGLGWNQIRIIACGDNDRLVKSTYDELGHRQNQRVEVIETDETVLDEAEAAKEAETGEAPAADGQH